MLAGGQSKFARRFKSPPLRRSAHSPFSQSEDRNLVGGGPEIATVRDQCLRTMAQGGSKLESVGELEAIAETYSCGTCWDFGGQIHQLSAKSFSQRHLVSLRQGFFPCLSGPAKTSAGVTGVTRMRISPRSADRKRGRSVG